MKFTGQYAPLLDAIGYSYQARKPDGTPQKVFVSLEAIQDNFGGDPRAGLGRIQALAERKLASNELDGDVIWLKKADFESDM